ncbi:MAG: hypothetical protein PVG39_10445 [Desulfobacteraceae bacterium]
MERGFSIDSRYSVGNLHVNLSGEFNGLCAWELVKTIKLKNKGKGRVFVNTDKLNSILIDGIELFKMHMCGRQMKKDWLYFKGDKGFEIAPDGSRVLICGKGDERSKKEKEGRSCGPLRKTLHRSQ